MFRFLFPVLLLMAGCITQSYSDTKIHPEMTIARVGTKAGWGSAVLLNCKKIDTDVYELSFLTCVHVVKDDDNPVLSLYSILPHRLPFYLGDVLSSIVSKDPDRDLAVLSARWAQDLPTIGVQSYSPQYGDEIVSVGFPMSMGPLVTTGYFSGFSPKEYPLRSLVTCNIFFGNSGGPVISSKTGKLIGITTSLYVVQGTTIPYLQLISPIFYPDSPFIHQG